VLPCSFGMAATEVYVIAAIVVTGYNFWAVVGMGLGGGTGALASMYLHRKFLGSKS